MKKKYLILLVLVASFSACTDKFEEFNTDVKNPAVVNGESLFTNAQFNLAWFNSSTNVNRNIFKLMSQYWTETTYIDEANYDITNRAIPDQIFEDFYQGFLKDFQEAAMLIEATVPTSAVGETEKANKLAIIELLNVYSYHNLVDIFGDVPYSAAMDIENISPAYDDAATIYSDLIARIDAAVGNLDDSEGSFGPADIIYEGDVASWKKFGNSLKLKIGIALSDVNTTLAKSTVESAISGGVFTSSDDNALFPFMTATHPNPLYEDLVQSGRNDFVAANTIVDIMNTLSDPRRPFYFTTIGGIYSGGQYGYNSPYSAYSHVPDYIAAPDFHGMLLTYDEILFYKAEAAARGYSVGGTVAALYNDAITASILWWGGTGAAATTYLAQPSVAYATATGTYKQKIGTQAWIAFYTRGLEGYNMWRRMDYPIFNIGSLITSYDEIPVRFSYPVSEQTLNNASYTAAAAAIGGDLISTKIFWDVE